MERPADAHAQLCPACHRVNDELPAGEVTLSGSFVTQHREEILHIIGRQEEIEKPDHPLNRIMKIDDAGEEIIVTTTELHLPHRIGEALKSAFDGELEFNYDEDGNFLRVGWHRDRD